MNEILQQLVLGFVQGITEFLPVSSSGHLVIFGQLLGQNDESFIVEVLLHIGTLLATIIVFRSEILNLIKGIIKGDKDQRKLALMIVVASIPTALTGFLLKDLFESIFSKPLWVCVFLIITGFVLFFTKNLESIEFQDKSIKTWQAFVIGVAQSFAILPGISRSGSTIAMAIYMKMDRKFAGEFSFLISLPAIFGATLLTFKDWLEHGASSDGLGGATIIGILTAFLTGLFSLKWLLSFVQSGKLYVFSYYLWPIGFAGLIYFS